MDMPHLTAAQTRDRLDYVALADAIEAMARRAYRGEASAPERQILPLAADGTLLVMPAADNEIAMTKIVTVHPANGDRGLATLQGEMMVMDAATGQRYGLLDGATISGRRTAALSLLGARHLAPRPDASLLIVGAGTQARAHLEAFHVGLGTRRVYVVSRTREPAEQLARYAASLGIEARVLDGIDDAPADIGLYVSATTSTQPVLPDTLPADVFVAAVGAFRPGMAELPPALLGDATVIVDTLAGAQSEAGDLRLAADAGALQWRQVHELPALLVEGMPTLRGPVIFKSVGHSLWDLAAARLAFSCA